MTKFAVGKVRIILWSLNFSPLFESDVISMQLSGIVSQYSCQDKLLMSIDINLKCSQYETCAICTGFIFCAFQTFLTAIRTITFIADCFFFQTFYQLNLKSIGNVHLGFGCITVKNGKLTPAIWHFCSSDFYCRKFIIIAGMVAC